MLAVFMLHGVSYLMHVRFFLCLEISVKPLGGKRERFFFLSHVLLLRVFSLLLICSLPTCDGIFVCDRLDSQL